MIYHYTTVSTLEKIISNKTIRLNRLDHVDDKTEEEAFKGINFAKYIFVSSWTEKTEEDLYQWKEYASDYSGIRIGLPENMFKLKLVSEKMYPNAKYNGIRIFGKAELILKPEEVFTDSYEILPLFTKNSSFKLKVNYVDDIYDIKKKIEEIQRNKDSINITLYGDWLQRAAATKNIIWKNQQEIRFVLFIFPAIKKVSHGYDDPLFSENNINYKSNCLLNGIPPAISFIDLELSEDALDEIEIMIGPHTSEEDQLIVKKLIETNCKNGTIVKSILTGTLRKRQT